MVLEDSCVGDSSHLWSPRWAHGCFIKEWMAQLWWLFQQEHLFYFLMGVRVLLGFLSLPSLEEMDHSVWITVCPGSITGDGSQTKEAWRMPVHPLAGLLLVLLWASDESCVPAPPPCLHTVGPHQEVASPSSQEAGHWVWRGEWLVQVVSSERGFVTPNLLMQLGVALPWHWSPLSWVAFFPLSFSRWGLAPTCCFLLPQCQPSSQISLQLLPQLPPGLPLPGPPTCPLPKDLLQSGGAQPLTWPLNTEPCCKLTACFNDSAQWLRRHRGNTWKGSPPIKCCLLWQDRKRPSASEKTWQQGTAWRAEETADEWAARAAEETVDFNLFIKLNYLHEGVGCSE